jgi:protein-S-isoprenylcysteine O-methyltransferase Ste14
MSRLATFIYGVVSYALFSGVILYAVGFLGGFLTPTLMDGPPRSPLPVALAVDLGLLAVFAVQHSGMARPAFKRWWTRIVPEAVERSTYVLVSSLLMIGLFAWWQPIGGEIWRAPDGWPRNAMIGLNLFGWALLFYATFLIDHFDLFGLKQVWRRLRGEAYRPPQFYTPSLYKVMRHPIYVGWLAIFWAAPIMTIAHLVFALTTTAYILIAIQLEERDLVDAFGATYIEYSRRTPMLLPRLWPKRAGRAREVRT